MEPVSLVLARARIAGGVLLEREAPAEVPIRAGDEVLVKFPFRFDEVSREREDYRVVLRIRLDGEPAREQTFEGKDHPALDDGRRGLLMERLRILATGTHTLEFQARVHLSQSEWGSDETALDEAEIEGQVRLVAA